MEKKDFFKMTEKLITVGCKSFRCNKSDFNGKTRFSDIVKARHVVRAFIRQIKPKEISWEELETEVSKVFEHSSSIRSTEVTRNLRETNYPRGIRARIDSCWLKMQDVLFEYTQPTIDKISCNKCSSENIILVTTVHANVDSRLVFPFREYRCINCGNVKHFTRTILEEETTIHQRPRKL